MRIRSSLNFFTILYVLIIFTHCAQAVIEEKVVILNIIKDVFFLEVDEASLIAGETNTLRLSIQDDSYLSIRINYPTNRGLFFSGNIGQASGDGVWSIQSNYPAGFSTEFWMVSTNTNQFWLNTTAFYSNDLIMDSTNLYLEWEKQTVTKKGLYFNLSTATDQNYTGQTNNLSVELLRNDFYIFDIYAYGISNLNGWDLEAFRQISGVEWILIDKVYFTNQKGLKLQLSTTNPTDFRALFSAIDDQGNILQTVSTRMVWKEIPTPPPALELSVFEDTNSIFSKSKMSVTNYTKNNLYLNINVLETNISEIIIHSSNLYKVYNTLPVDAFAYEHNRLKLTNLSIIKNYPSFIFGFMALREVELPLNIYMVSADQSYTQTNTCYLTWKEKVPNEYFQLTAGDMTNDIGDTYNIDLTIYKTNMQLFMIESANLQSLTNSRIPPAFYLGKRSIILTNSSILSEKTNFSFSFVSDIPAEFEYTIRAIDETGITLQSNQTKTVWLKAGTAYPTSNSEDITFVYLEIGENQYITEHNPSINTTPITAVIGTERENADSMKVSFYAENKDSGESYLITESRNIPIILKRAQFNAIIANLNIPAGDYYINADFYLNNSAGTVISRYVQSWPYILRISE